VILLLAFLPILYTVVIGNPVLYLWADPAKLASDHVLHAKAWWLNPTGYAVRLFIYLAIFIIFSWKMSASTIRQDASGNANEQQMRANWAAPGLVVFMLTVTAAFTDWVMSLEPYWSSTMYGPWWAVGSALAALAFLTITATLNVDRDPYQGVVTHNWTRDMGNLMFTFTMLWGYTTFSQYLIIWSGNIPEETGWFQARTMHGWGYIAWALVLFHFAAPFLVLLMQDLKRRAKTLALVAIFILFMRFVDMYWLIGPSPRISTHGETLGLLASFSWMDIVGPIAVGGIWLWYFFGQLMKRPLAPVMDPFLEKAIEHGHGH
jgi:hypothetical protein